MIEADGLKAIAGTRHGFFTRQGGVSDGIYASLNTGLGSNDKRENVLANREKIRGMLAAEELVTPYQVHGRTTKYVQKSWALEKPPKADAVVTDKPGIAVAVNTADCTPVLFASADGSVVGAAHAGWKGAVGGILKSAVKRMRGLGAKNIHAAIGPTISRFAYEVGPEFRERFVGKGDVNEQFFKPSARQGYFKFDLPGFVRLELEGLELAGIEDLALCTYGNEEQFFSYRRTTHRDEPDYGRQLAAIVRY